VIGFGLLSLFSRRMRKMFISVVLPLSVLLLILEQYPFSTMAQSVIKIDTLKGVAYSKRSLYTKSNQLPEFACL
jgi:hypothetical protein